MPEGNGLMPHFTWEWKISPSTIVAILQLVAIIVAIGGGFIKMQSDLATSQRTIDKLEVIIASVRNAQSQQSERVTRVETKVDLMIPALQRIESRLAIPMK